MSSQGTKWLLLATSLAFVSCKSASNYVADRGLDFLDQYRIAVGAGSTVGVRASSLGLMDTGLLLGIKPRAAALGWRYGQPMYFDTNDPRFDSDQAEIIKTTSVIGYDYSKAYYERGWNSLGVLPAVFTWVDSSPKEYEWKVPEEGSSYEDRFWIWSSEGFSNNRYQQIHAFDMELELALLVYVDMGFSPGELLDFLLGIFTIDIARDDHRL